MEKSNYSNEKISEALKMLDDAAKSKKKEVQDLLRDKYQNIKDAITGFDSKERIESIKQSAANAAAKARELSEDRVKEIAKKTDQNVHDNPWPYIGGAAFCSLLIGYILGRKD